MAKRGTAEQTRGTGSTMTTTTQTKWASRAVLRPIEAGNTADCVTCGEPVKFKAKVKANQVICNVYVDGRWDRVEHYHAECYGTDGEPYGPAQQTERRRPERLSA